MGEPSLHDLLRRAETLCGTAIFADLRIQIGRFAACDAPIAARETLRRQIRLADSIGARVRTHGQFDRVEPRAR